MARAVLLASSLQPARLRGAGASKMVEPARSAAPGYKLGHPGRPADHPTLLIAIFDNSGSVTSAAGTDPLSNRYAEVNRAFSVVASKGAANELGAIIHFDTPSSGEIGPVPLTRRGLRTLRRGLQAPPDGAGTSELRPSLDLAFEISEVHPEHDVTLVVLSDFFLMDAEPGPVLSDLAAFPGRVHAVVLGRQLPAGVLDSRITVTTIGRDDPPGAVARAVFASLITHRPGGRLSGTGVSQSHVSRISQRLFRTRLRPPDGVR